MIVSRALLREATVNSFGIAVVLFGLMLFVGLTQALGQAAIGAKTSDIALKLFTLEMLRAVDTLLPLAMFLGILITVGRWYRDSEMTVLAACGIGVARLWRPVLFFALAVAAVTATSSLYLSPLAASHIERLKREARQQVLVAGIKPGVFTEIANKKGILYVERVGDVQEAQVPRAQGSAGAADVQGSTSAAGGRTPEAADVQGSTSAAGAGRAGAAENGVALYNIFVSNLNADTRASAGTKQNIAVARQGRRTVDVETGEQFVVLEKGRMYEGRPGAADFRILEFDKMTLRLRNHGAARPRNPIEATPTGRLLDPPTPRRWAEWHWRMARPLAVFVLATLAIVLAYADPRRGRFGNFFLAVLIFFLYSNLLGVGVGLIKNEKVSPQLGLWWVHMAFAALALYLLWRRNNNKPPLLARIFAR